ncbi:MAG: hypothetical protein P8020_22080 [Acidobacteriota bacterium]
MKIERAHRRTHKPLQEYRFKEAQLVVRDNPSLPVEIEAPAGVQFDRIAATFEHAPSCPFRQRRRSGEPMGLLDSSPRTSWSPRVA